MAPITLRVEAEHTLLPYLFERLAAFKRGEVKRMLRFGSVYVNGLRTTRHDKPLRPGDEVRIKRDATRAGSGRPTAARGLEIVYEDRDLVVVNKPVGLLTVSTADEQEHTAYRELTEYLRRKGELRGRLHVVHRLDRETSGLLIFARSDAVRKAFHENWGEVEKRYYAVVEGLPKADEGTVRSHLAQDKSLRVRSVQPSEDAKLAVTHYRVIRRGRRRALLDVLLETGRKNQIRVHLAERNHPVVGDPKYGAKQGPGGRMGLHAYRLAFTHPVTGERLDFETPLPAPLERMLD
jgi:23S rRNA pseudouridine1911/1915/1917 synthase